MVADRASFESRRHAAQPAQSPLRLGHQPARRRAEAGEAVPPSARARRRAARWSICCFICRPAPIDRRARPKLRDVAPGTIVTVEVTVDRHRPRRRAARACPIASTPATRPATITLTFFHARKDYLEKLLPVGETRYVSGTAALYDGMLQMVHPDRVVDEEGLADLAADRAGLSADRGLIAAIRCAARSMRALRASSRTCRNGRTRRGCAQSSFPAFGDALRHACTGRAEPADIAARRPGLVAARL